MEALCEQELAEKSTPLPAPVYSELLIMDWRENGHVRFDRTDPTEIAAARARFAELRSAGYLAYKLDASATRGEVLDTFDPNAERTVFHPQMVGG